MQPRLLWILTTSLAVASCQTALTEKTMGDGLRALKGAHYQKAIDALGIPTSERTIADKKIYRWSTGWSESLTLPTVSTGRGFAGATPITTTTYGTQTTSHAHDCYVDISTNQKGIIEQTEYEGTVQGCQKYVKRLQEMLSQK